MKLTKNFLIVLICLVSLFFVTSCVIEDDNNEENNIETTASFSSYIGSIEEVEDKFKCLLVLEPLQGTFKENVKNNEIYFEEGLKDVSNVEIVTSSKEKIELYFDIARIVEDAIEFEVEGTVKLGEGVLLDLEGKQVGEVATVQVYKNPLATIQYGSIYYFDQLKINLNHEGVYIARFYITWTEITGWRNLQSPYDRDEMRDEFNELDVKEKLKYATPYTKEKSWDQNGQIKTRGYSREINFSNTEGNGYYNVKIRAEVKTGLVWDPWHVICNDYISENTAELTVRGTTLNTKYMLVQYHLPYNLPYIDEVINLAEFKKETTEEGKILCSLTLGTKDNTYYYEGDVSIKLSGIIDDVFIVNVGNSSKTVSFQFEVEQEKWDENGNILNIFINSGLSGKLGDAYKDLTVLLK